MEKKLNTGDLLNVVNYEDFNNLRLQIGEFKQEWMDKLEQLEDAEHQIVSIIKQKVTELKAKDDKINELQLLLEAQETTIQCHEMKKNVTQTTIEWLYIREEVRGENGIPNCESEKLIIRKPMSFSISHVPNGTDLKFNFNSDASKNLFAQIFENTQLFKLGLLKYTVGKRQVDISLDALVSTHISTKDYEYYLDDEFSVLTYEKFLIEDIIERRNRWDTEKEAALTSAHNGIYDPEYFTTPIENIKIGTKVRCKKPKSCGWSSERKAIEEAKIGTIYLPMVQYDSYCDQKFGNKKKDSQMVTVVYEGSERLAKRLKEVLLENVIFI